MRISDRKKIIKSLLSGKLTKEKRQSFLDVESVEKEIEKQWDKSGKELVSHIVKEQMWKNIKMKCEGKQKSKVHIVLWPIIAASVAILLVIGGFWFNSHSTKIQMEELISVIAKTNQMYQLPDSSKVWMQPGSTIRFAKDFNKSRKVWLSGSSLFEVRKHQGSNFCVYINKAFIEVKGTCFLVKQDDPNTSDITLFRGKIEFNIEATNEKIAIKPAQKLIYNPTNAEVEMQKVENVDWKDGRFYFTDISLVHFINIVNKMNDSNIILEKGVNEKLFFSGSISYDESLSDIAAKICFIMNLQKKEDGKQIIIHK